ncbi:gamma-secretase subunit APH-1A isoform X4 [Hirundo rustica]|uniref:gamma-secretase subunit APH-1A isoform X4 n=1 Tax=Hirundo rustica TaxID=43150 RepID=UPI001A93F918|nr:gamma-secretase subunit APH-1A isoform X4 [Hirundo rustica]
MTDQVLGILLAEVLIYSGIRGNRKGLKPCTVLHARTVPPPKTSGTKPRQFRSRDSASWRGCYCRHLTTSTVSGTRETGRFSGCCRCSPPRCSGSCRRGSAGGRTRRCCRSEPPLPCCCRSSAGSPASKYSTFLTMALVLLHTFWGIIFFDACERRRTGSLGLVVGSHLLTSGLTFLNPWYEASLGPIFILTFCTGLWAFGTAGGSFHNVLKCLSCKQEPEGQVMLYSALQVPPEE